MFLTFTGRSHRTIRIRIQIATESREIKPCAKLSKTRLLQKIGDTPVKGADSKWHRRYTPPCRAPGCSYTPVAALSAVLSVSQGCRSHPHPPKGPVAPHPEPPVALQGGGAASIVHLRVSRYTLTLSADFDVCEWSREGTSELQTFSRPRNSTVTL